MNLSCEAAEPIPKSSRPRINFEYHVSWGGRAYAYASFGDDDTANCRLFMLKMRLCSLLFAGLLLVDGKLYKLKFI